MPARSAILAILLLIVGGLWACWCDTAMIWDGAYQFAFTVMREEPYFYLSRAHSYVLWLPVTWLQHLTSNVAVLKFVYGLPLCLAPAAAVALSWWITRRTAPHLFLWAAFGSAIGTLPGQIFMINDSIFQMHALWPVFLGVFVPLTRVQLVAMVLLSLFQLSHPIGILACPLIAASAVVVGVYREPERRGALFAWAGWLVLLAIGGVVKLKLWPDSYAAQEATLQRAIESFVWGVVNWPLKGLLAMYCAAFVLAWRARRSAERDYTRVVLLLVLFTAVLWTFCAAVPRVWSSSINYRRWVLPMSLPFFAAALYEIWLGRRAVEIPEHLRVLRGRVAIGVCAIFLVVLGAQSASWHALWRRLEAQVAGTKSPIISGLWKAPDDQPPVPALATEGATDWTHNTPLDHWGIYSQVLVIQGQRPQTLYLHQPQLEAARETPPRIALSPFTLMEPSTSGTGWFQWGAALERLRASAVAPQAATPSSPALR